MKSEIIFQKRNGSPRNAPPALGEELNARFSAMKSIIAPVDFSTVTPRVVDAAIKLARMAKARVVLLHVVPEPAFIRNLLPAVEDVKMRKASAGRQAEKKLVELKRTFRRKYPGLEIIHRSGPAAPGIVEEARASRASYIVMGSHGRSAVRDVLVGSVAAAVIKTAPCPVLVIPPIGASLK